MGLNILLGGPLAVKTRAVRQLIPLEQKLFFEKRIDQVFLNPLFYPFETIYRKYEEPFSSTIKLCLLAFLVRPNPKRSVTPRPLSFPPSFLSSPARPLFSSKITISEAPSRLSRKSWKKNDDGRKDLQKGLLGLKPYPVWMRLMIIHGKASKRVPTSRRLLFSFFFHLHALQP